MAGLVFTEVTDSQDEWGKTRVKFWDITLGTSYGTGGFAVTAANVGLRVIYGAKHVGGNAAASTSGLLFGWDVTNKKIICTFPTGGASSPTSITAPVAAVPGLGTLGVTTTPAVGATPMASTSAQPAMAGVLSGALAAPALTGGQGIEVGATADLSSLSIRMLFFGN